MQAKFCANVCCEKCACYQKLKGSVFDTVGNEYVPEDKQHELLSIPGLRKSHCCIITSAVLAGTGEL